MILQWNPSIAATLGGKHFGRYIGVAFIEGVHNRSFGTWVPGRYTEVAFIQGWPLRGVPLYYHSDYNSTILFLFLHCLKHSS